MKWSISSAEAWQSAADWNQVGHFSFQHLWAQFNHLTAPEPFQAAGHSDWCGHSLVSSLFSTASWNEHFNMNISFLRFMTKRHCLRFLFISEMCTRWLLRRISLMDGARGNRETGALHVQYVSFFKTKERQKEGCEQTSCQELKTIPMFTS